MLRNYLKILFRQLIKNKAYSFINIGGLAIGISAVLLILIYVQFEKSYDADLKLADRLYRVNLTSFSDGNLVESSSRTSPAMGSVFKEEVPAVSEFSRVVILGEVIAGHEEEFVREENIFLADAHFVDFFDLNLLRGSDERMQEPLKAMISDQISSKLFKETDPIGKMLEINSTNFDGTVAFEIIGLYESPPANRHLKPEIVISYASLYHFVGKEIDQSFDWLNLYTFLKLEGQQDISSLDEQLNAILQKNQGDKLKSTQTDWQVNLQPVNQIHNSTVYIGEYEQGVDGKKLHYFIWIAAFILLMVYLNSINIANAKAMNRTKEIGVRKVSGGSKYQLFFQFMMESLIVNFMAVILAGLIIGTIGSQLVERLNLDLPNATFSIQAYHPLLWSLWIFGTLVSGIYPAVILTSFSPANALKGTLKFKLKTAFARPLLISQLVFCLIILSGILTVYFQLNHMRAQNLGISLTDKIVVRSPMLFIEGSGNYQEQIQQHFGQLPGVKNVAASNEVPGNEVYWRSDQFFREGGTKNGTMYTMLNVGNHYFDVFGIGFKAGRDFNTALEQGQEAVINEKAREALGFQTNADAVGQKLMFTGFGEPRGVEIVGVIDDYRQQGVNVAVNPMVLNYSSGDLNYYIVEVERGQMAQVLPQLETLFQTHFPSSPFEYYFLDEHFEKQYKSEQQFVQIFGMAALVAIIIAVMGIFGVSTQLIIQRNKEVSIRKILGASFGNVFYLISKEYLTWLGICFAMGIPLSYHLFSGWLDNIITKIPLDWWFFTLPPLAVLVIFICATIFQTVKVSLVSPVETLKNE
ncbi:ABC transporter permease [Pleomorphovibrio marinus]|uniref:ABC transporter permease n=1 Tax=Pleomorphovibrio marinus TaxID=2164132 RepID=UPI000E0B8BFF|nr:ABC transporter permease [Pleomorphovibrio marinus]